MSFSDRQIRLLRTRLRAYRLQQGEKKLGRALPWKTVATRINGKLRLDFDVGGDEGERLRQFVIGVPIKNESKELRPRIPEDHRLEAIRDFLSHPDVRYLSEHELQDDPELHPAARSFLDYLKDDGGAVDASSTDRLLSEQVMGIYQYRCDDDDLLEHRRLSLILLSDGLFQVEEVTEKFDVKQAVSDFSQWDQPEKYRRRRSHRRRTGWAVKNDYDCIYFFLKDQGDSSITSYIALLHESTSNNKAAIKWLYLQNYGPVSYFATWMMEAYDMFISVVSKLEAEYLILFERVE